MSERKRLLHSGATDDMQRANQCVLMSVTSLSCSRAKGTGTADCEAENRMGSVTGNCSALHALQGTRTSTSQAGQSYRGQSEYCACAVPS